MVIRTDDNGVAYLVHDDLSLIEADTLMDEFFGHKQTYFKLSYTSTIRSKVISDNHIHEY
jgi:hypothetical protein